MHGHGHSHGESDSNCITQIGTISEGLLSFISFLYMLANFYDFFSDHPEQKNLGFSIPAICFSAPLTLLLTICATGVHNQVNRAHQISNDHLPSNAINADETEASGHGHGHGHGHQCSHTISTAQKLLSRGDVKLAIISFDWLSHVLGWIAPINFVVDLIVEAHPMNKAERASISLGLVALGVIACAASIRACANHILTQADKEAWPTWFKKLFYKAEDQQPLLGKDEDTKADAWTKLQVGFEAVSSGISSFYCLGLLIDFFASLEDQDIGIGLSKTGTLGAAFACIYLTLTSVICHFTFSANHQKISATHPTSKKETLDGPIPPHTRSSKDQAILYICTLGDLLGHTLDCTSIMTFLFEIINNKLEHPVDDLGRKIAYGAFIGLGVLGSLADATTCYESLKEHFEKRSQTKPNQASTASLSWTTETPLNSGSMNPESNG